MKIPELFTGAWLIAFALIMLTGFPAYSGQTTIEDYVQARPIFWRGLYPNGGFSLYCNRPFRPYDRGVNIEHVFPMSWAKNAFDCRTRKQCRQDLPAFNYLEADLHNLYPALVPVNDARGSQGFADLPEKLSHFHQCEFKIDTKRRRVEPRDEIKGRIARAMFYMADAYNLPIFRSQGQLLTRWHFRFPPDTEENRRNNVIFRIQGTRNPFIDNPDAVSKFGW